MPKGKAEVSKGNMLHFDLSSPVEMLWFGEFVSPEKGWRHLTRRLYEYELMIVTEGELCIGNEETEFRVPAGEYLILPPTMNQHGTRECRCRFYWMHFRCPALPATLSMPRQGKVDDGKEISLIASRLLAAEAKAPRGTRSLYLATLLLLALADGAPPPESALPPRKAVCARVKEYVVYHRFSAIRVKDIARELGYHEKYLSAIFHAEEGVELKDYIAERRAEEAKRLLLESDYSVTEIARYLNFGDPHGFARFFRAKVGLSPTAFRSGGNEKERKA